MYSVDYDGKRFIQDSPLGMKTNIGDYTDGLSISGDPFHRRLSRKVSCYGGKKRREMVCGRNQCRRKSIETGFAVAV